MALMQTLTDDFATQNAAKWTYGNSAAATGGVANIPPNASYLPGLISVASYDLTASYAFFQTVSLGTADFFFTLNDSTSPVHTNALRYQKVGATLTTGIMSAGDDQDGSPFTYDPVAHKWLRIGVVGTNAVFDASPDGVTWTNLRTAPKVITVTALYVHFMGGGTGAPHVIDNFNTVIGVAAMATLTDNFTTQDATKWVYGNGATASGGQAVIPPNAGYLPGLISVNPYNLTGSQASVQLVSLGTADFFFTLSASNSDAHTTAFRFQRVGTVLTTQIMVGGVDQLGAPFTYSAVNHKWLRIRELSSNVLFDASPDGINWTNLRNVPKLITVTALYVQLMGGGSGASHVLDNFNTTPSSTLMQILADNFSSQDATKWTYGNGATATGGQAVIPPNASYLPGLISVNAYDLTNSYALVQIVSLGTADFFFTLNDSTSPTHTTAFRFQKVGATLTTQIMVGGLDQDGSPFAYDPVAHKWLRIIGVGGNVEFHASADGITWFNLRSAPALISMTALYVQFMGGGAGANHVLDNFNTAPPPVVTLPNSKFFAALTRKVH